MDSQILINDVEIFNGKEPQTLRGNVLIRNNRIERISREPIPADPAAGVRALDGKGRFLMPGLIDAHWHAYLCSNTMQDLLMSDPSYMHLAAGREAGATLLRGFTTIRDAGGPVFGLKRAIDTGLLPGPRIYPSGAMISQTSGHGDFRMIYDHFHGGCGCEAAHIEQLGASRIVDGTDAVTAATRENLRQGASQIKLMTGGGAASLYDPLDVTEFFRGRDSRRSPRGGRLGHVCHGARLQSAGHCAGHSGRRQKHRTRPPDRRADNGVACGKRCLAQHAGIRRRGQQLPFARTAGQAHRDHPRNGPHLQPREKNTG